ncbi:MAG: hypothetical protein AB7S38_40535 [Vulcanimicrobiota bacterium]
MTRQEVNRAVIASTRKRIAYLLLFCLTAFGVFAIHTTSGHFFCCGKVVCDDCGPTCLLECQAAKPLPAAMQDSLPSETTVAVPIRLEWAYLFSQIQPHPPSPEAEPELAQEYTLARCGLGDLPPPAL